MLRPGRDGRGGRRRRHRHAGWRGARGGWRWCALRRGLARLRGNAEPVAGAKVVRIPAAVGTAVIIEDAILPSRVELRIGTVERALWQMSRSGDAAERVTGFHLDGPARTGRAIHGRRVLLCALHAALKVGLELPVVAFELRRLAADFLGTTKHWG